MKLGQPQEQQARLQQHMAPSKEETGLSVGLALGQYQAFSWCWTMMLGIWFSALVNSFAPRHEKRGVESSAKRQQCKTRLGSALSCSFELHHASCIDVANAVATAAVPDAAAPGGRRLAVVLSQVMMNGSEL